MGLVVYDTSILVELEREKEADPRVEEESKGNDVGITAPTVSEIWLGTADKSEEKRKEVDERMDKYDILNTTKNSSKLFSEITLELKRKGKPIPDFDVLIASIVMDRNAKLLAKDSHFKSIEGLNVEILE